jgi:hypothetical protein
MNTHKINSAKNIPQVVGSTFVDTAFPPYLPNEIEIVRITYKDRNPVSVRTSFDSGLLCDRLVTPPNFECALRLPSAVPITVGELHKAVLYSKHGIWDYLRERFPSGRRPKTLRDFTNGLEVYSKWYPSLSRAVDVHIKYWYHVFFRGYR